MERGMFENDSAFRTRIQYSSLASRVRCGDSDISEGDLTCVQCDYATLGCSAARHIQSFDSERIAVLEVKGPTFVTRTGGIDCNAIEGARILDSGDRNCPSKAFRCVICVT